MYLYGKNSVLERLRARPQTIRKIFLQDNFDAQNILELIRKRNISISRVSEKEMFRIKRADRLQGIVAEVDNFIYAPFDELLDKKSHLLLLDNINDPQNLGSIMRIAACFGSFAIVIPKHNSCEINETVLHVALGGENTVPAAMVSNLSNALIEAKKSGYWAVGAVVEGGEDLSKAKLPFPLCLLLGSEGKGIRQGLQSHIDLKVSIPMFGASLSLNVAMASAVFCYEIMRQEKMGI